MRWSWASDGRATHDEGCRAIAEELVDEGGDVPIVNEGGTEPASGSGSNATNRPPLEARSSLSRFDMERFVFGKERMVAAVGEG